MSRPQGSGCDIGAYEAEVVEVGDLVWEDRDGDGEKGVDEPGIGGVTLALVNSDDETAATATTDSDGGYSFRVTAGEWTVRVTDTAGVLTGHQPPAETSKTEDVSAGSAANLAFDFGYAPLVTIGDLIWHDANGDGVQDAGEPGIEDVTVELVDTSGNVEGTDETDSDGEYSFEELSGEWTVRVDAADPDLAGYRATTPSSLTLPVAAGGATALNFDFGYEPAAGASAEPVINVNTLAGDAVDGRCSLAEAIEAANEDKTVDGCLAGSGDDTVNVSVPGVITAPDGGFQITSDVTVQGHAGGTTISGGVDVVVTKSESPAVAAATDVKLADLTLTGSSGSGVEVVDYANSSVTDPYTVTLESLAVEASDRSGADAVRGKGVDVRAPLGSSRPGRVDITESVVKGSSYGVYVGSCDPRPADVTVTVTDSVIRDNTSGGAYNLCGDLRLVRSSVSGNSGSRAGVHSEYEGRPAAGGAPGTEIINTTVAGNTSTGLAGGVVVSQSGSAEPELSVKNSTIADNTGLLVGGVHTMGSVAASVVNSVVADNTATVAADTGAQCRFGSTPTTTANVWSDNSCGVALVEDDVGLGELTDNGGATGIGPNDGLGHVLTMAVGSASPLLAAADEGDCPDEDARGMARPAGSGCDIGAYEADETTIGGFVWADLNGNAARDDVEPGVGGVTLDLVDSAGEAISTETTGPGGRYGFKVLEGTWKVAVTDEHDALSGYEPSTATEARRQVTAGAPDLSDVEFGYRGSVEIGDEVWKDTDHYGVKDAGEAAFGDVRVELLKADGDVASDTETGADGRYSFYVPEGTWTVRVAESQGDPDPLGGYRATTAPSLTLPVAAGSGVAGNYDFGYELLASVKPRGRTVNVSTLGGDVDDGLCSLAEAIEAANTDEAVDGCLAGSGADAIVISKEGVIGEVGGAGRSRIASDMTIQGHGHGDGTTIRSGGFDIVLTKAGAASAADEVKLADLTIAGPAIPTRSGTGVFIDDQTTATGPGTEFSVVLENLEVSGHDWGVYYSRPSGSARPGSVEVKSSIVTTSIFSGVVWSGCDTGAVGVSLTVANSEIRDNGKRNHSGAGLRNYCGSVKVVDSLISGTVYGPGVDARPSRGSTTDTEIVNTTIDGNRDGGVYVRGSGTLKVVNSTITGNGSAGVSAENAANVSLSMANTVIAGHTTGCSSGWRSADFEANASSDGTCGDAQERADLGLAELGDNGGAAPLGPNGGGGNVRTRAIDATSPLFNKADAAACRDMFKEDDSDEDEDEEDSDEDEPEAARDARGVSRPQGSVCDIGAYEAGHVARVEGRVWKDRDGDGAKDDGEPVVDGAVLALAASDGAPFRTTAPDADGRYSFEVTPGDWKITVTNPPAGHRGPTEIPVTTTEADGGTSLSGRDFAYAPVIRIGDLVWDDADGDEDKDPNERGMPGVTVELTGGAAAPEQKTTNADGKYFFDVTPGEWTVTVTDTAGVLAGYQPPTDTSVTADVQVGGVNWLDFDFGYRRLVTIGDLVWADSDGDGMKDDTELGIAGVTVELTGGGGAPRTATTNASGRYSFDVTPGDWTIRVTGPPGLLARYRPTTPTSLTLPVALGGASVSNFDFGYTATTGDHVINVNTLDGRSVPDKDEDRRAARDGRCSLAEALRAAETDQAFDGCLAGSGDDKIKIRVAGVITSGSDFQVKSNVTVEGAAAGTTVNGGGFEVVVTDGDSPSVGDDPGVELADLTVTGAGGPGVEIEDQAAATVTAKYAVTLKNLHLNANQGGGVKLDKALASGRGGTVTVENTVLEANRVAGAYIDACAPTSEATVTVTIRNSVVKTNRGGGVHNMCGALKIVNSLITGNRGLAGGIYADDGRSSGGASASTETEVVNTTIAANTSMDPGGAITVSGSAGLTPKLDLKNVTISANTSFDGPGGVHVEGTVGVSITNTVVAGNTGDQCSSGLKTTLKNGDASSNSGNASSDDTCGFGLENITSGLAGLANNGGVAPIGPNGGNGNVHTMAIDATSPLHDAGHAASCQATDARGQPRPTGGVGCDIGAYEAQ